MHTGTPLLKILDLPLDQLASVQFVQACSIPQTYSYLQCVIEPSTKQLWVIICQPHTYRIGNQGERDSVRLFGPPPCLLHLSCNTHSGLNTEGIKAVPHYFTITVGVNTERKGSITLWQQQRYICSDSYEEKVRSATMM